jgi:hypothetical protein
MDAKKFEFLAPYWKIERRNRVPYPIFISHGQYWERVGGPRSINHVESTFDGVKYHMIMFGLPPETEDLTLDLVGEGGTISFSEDMLPDPTMDASEKNHLSHLRP